VNLISKFQPNLQVKHKAHVKKSLLKENQPSTLSGCHSSVSLTFSLGTVKRFEDNPYPCAGNTAKHFIVFCHYVFIQIMFFHKELQTLLFKPWKYLKQIKRVLIPPFSLLIILRFLFGLSGKDDMHGTCIPLVWVK
jgi:hypothetical protein